MNSLHYLILHVNYTGFSYTYLSSQDNYFFFWPAVFKCRIYLNKQINMVCLNLHFWSVILTFLFVFEPCPAAMLRYYSWLCALGAFLVVFRRLYVMPEIEYRVCHMQSKNPTSCAIILAPVWLFLCLSIYLCLYSLCFMN